MKLADIFKPVLTGTRAAGAYLAKYPGQAIGIADKLAEKHRAHKEQKVAQAQAVLTTEILQQQVSALEKSVDDKQSELARNLTELRNTVDLLNFELSDLARYTSVKLRVLTAFLVVAYAALIAGAVVLALFVL